MLLTSFQEALAFFDAYAMKEHRRLKGGPQLARMRGFLNLLGNPQNRLRVLHVAGTSGKGSTATIAAHLLAAHGKRVGLSVSPHLFDIRERMQVLDFAAVDDRMGAINRAPTLSGGRFVALVNRALPILKQLEARGQALPSYFELLTALAFVLFDEERVDYAVIETGMGGRFDSTNVIDREDKICLLTRIGLDHMEYLGDTIEKIAWEKAGIIQKGNAVFSAIDCHVEMTWGRGLLGAHQVENANLATEAVAFAAQRDGWTFDGTCARHVLETIHIPGRADLRCVSGHEVLFDVAHNPQKMESLIQTLTEHWPNKKITFLVAFNPKAQYEAMLNLILPHATHLIITNFIVGDGAYRFTFADPSLLARYANDRGSLPTISTNPDTALAAAFATESDLIVVTGSFHFVAELMKRTKNN